MDKKREVVLVILFALVLVMAVLSFQKNVITGHVPSGYGSGPVLVFEGPTPAEASIREVYPNPMSVGNFVEINVSIEGDALDSFLFNWNGKSYDFYDDSLVRAYNFDNNPVFGETSSNFYDFSTYARNGACSGDSCPTITTGKYGSALHFDGNDVVNCVGDSSLSSSVGTISFWAKRDTQQATEYLLHIYQNQYTDYLVISFGNNGELKVTIEREDQTIAYGHGIIKLRDTNWHHIIVTQDGMGIRLFIDGTEDYFHYSTDSDTSAWTSHLTVSGCLFGAATYSVNPFQGSIDELRIYNEPWTNETANCEGYGVDAYPDRETVGPIGGGVGYGRIVNPADADYFVSTRTELDNALSQATSGQIIYVDDNAQINIDGWPEKIIPQGVTLASGRGRAGSQGGLIYMSQMHEGGLRVFRTSNDVRITGLRFEGPSDFFIDDSAPNDKTCAIYTYHNNENVEVDNNEIYLWGDAAFRVYSGSKNIYYHHNNIHHNKGWLGYGISTSKSYPIIEANIFDYNGHDVADGGYAESGYEAKYNIFHEYGGWGAYHTVDVHGEYENEKQERIAWWRFDEGQGTHAEDDAIYNYASDDNDGTLVNMNTATCWKNDAAYEHYKYSLEFDGVNDYVDCGSGNGLEDPVSYNEVTLEAFVKPTSLPTTGNRAVIAIKGDFSGTNGYALYLNGDDNKIYFSTGYASTSWDIPSGFLNNWHHVAGTYNGGTLRIYYDGIEKANTGSSSGIYNHQGSFTIGAVSGGTSAFRGQIDTVLLYNEAIDANYAYRHYIGNTDIAGKWFYVHHNDFREGVNRAGITVRGRPSDRFLVYKNKFSTKTNINMPYLRYVPTKQVNSEGNFYTYDNCYLQQHALSKGNLKKVSLDTWNFYYNASVLANLNYNYYTWASDTAGNSNYAYGRDDDVIYTASSPRYVNVKNNIKPNVTLMSPGHGTYDEDGSVTFTCDIRDNVALENITLRVWDDNGAVYYNNYENITGLYYNRYYKALSWQLTPMPEGNYTWNCLAYNVGYYADWGNTNNALFIGEEPAGYIPPEPTEPPEPPQPPEPPPVEPPTEPPTEPPATPPSTTEPTGGGGGGATTPVGSSNVLPPLIQPQAPEPEQEPPQEQEPGEELKGEESFFESLLFKEGKMRWEAILVIAITMMIIVYAVFYLSMQSKKI